MLTAKTTTTRDNILAAGLNLFSSKGFIATTTREIAREAGISEVTMFRYFPSKEKLLEEVIASFSFIPVLQTLQCEANDRTCEETLKLMAEALLDALLHRKEWVILMHSEVRRNPQKLLGIYHSFLDRLLGSLAAYLRAEQEKGTLRSIDPDIAARALYGMVFCYFNTEEVLLRKEYCPTDRRVAMHEFVQLFMRGASA